MGSLGLALHASAYAMDENNYTSSANLNVYQKLGLRIRLNPEGKLDLFAGVELQENLSNTTRSKWESLDGPIGERTYTGRWRGLSYYTLIGLRIGNPDKVSGMVQVCPFGGDVQNGNSSSGLAPTISGGINIPLGRRTAE